MIHRSKLFEIMEKVDAKGNSIPFSLTFIKMSTGEKIHIVDAFLKSCYYKKRCINIKIKGSKEIRTIRTILITEFNGLRVYV